MEAWQKAVLRNALKIHEMNKENKNTFILMPRHHGRTHMLKLLKELEIMSPEELQKFKEELDK